MSWNDSRSLRGTFRGFTLVELLVVISIIALLISILLPVLRSARETAIGVKCASQIRQVAMMTELYRNDFREYYVPITILTDPSDAATSVRWGALLKPYLNDTTAGINNLNRKGFLYCPSVIMEKRHQSASYTSYGYNRWGVGGNVPQSNGLPKMHRQIKSAPSDTLMFIDIQRTSDDARHGWFEAYPSTFFFYLRHNNAANAVYVDGHAKSLALDAILTDTVAATNKAPWFGDNSD